jgi:hypothetical protein
MVAAHKSSVRGELRRIMISPLLLALFLSTLLPSVLAAEAKTE